MVRLEPPHGAARPRGGSGDGDANADPCEVGGVGDARGSWNGVLVMSENLLAAPGRACTLVPRRPQLHEPQLREIARQAAGPRQCSCRFAMPAGTSEKV